VENSNRYAVGFVLVSALSLLNLVPIPYMTHRGGRRMQPYVKVVVAAFLAAPVVLFLLDWRYLFDVFFVCTAGYVAPGWIPVGPGGHAASRDARGGPARSTGRD